MIFKELSHARRMFFFMVEQVFLPMGKVWYMHNVDTRCTVGEERRPKGTYFFVYIFLVIPQNMNFISNFISQIYMICLDIKESFKKNRHVLLISGVMGRKSRIFFSGF